MKKEDVIGALRQIEERLSEVCESIGLGVERFILIPGKKGDPTIIQAVLSVEADAVLSETEREQRRVDLEFAAIEQSMEEEAFQDEKVVDVRKQIAEWNLD